MGKDKCRLGAVQTFVNYIALEKDTLFFGETPKKTRGTRVLHKIN